MNNNVQFRSLKDQLRCSHNQENIINSEKEQRQKLEKLEKRILDNLFDNLVRSNIVEKTKTDERGRLVSRELHFRLAIEEERAAWCVVIDDLMTEYENAIIRKSRDRSGAWKSVRIVKSAANFEPEQQEDEEEGEEHEQGQNENDDQEQEKQNDLNKNSNRQEIFFLVSSSAVPKISKKEEESPNLLPNFSSSPASSISDKKKTMTMTRGRPNPFASLISAATKNSPTQNNNNNKKTTTTADVARQRMDDVLIAHSKRNGFGTSVVERAADQRLMQQIIGARNKKEDVFASSLMKSK
jgi:hypothetical protein